MRCIDSLSVQKKTVLIRSKFPAMKMQSNVQLKSMSIQRHVVVLGSHCRSNGMPVLQNPSQVTINKWQSIYMIYCSLTCNRYCIFLNLASEVFYKMCLLSDKHAISLDEKWKHILPLHRGKMLLRKRQEYLKGPVDADNRTSYWSTV